MAANDIVVYKTSAGKRYVRYADGIVQSISGPEFDRFVANGATKQDPFDDKRIDNIINYSDNKKAAFKKAAGN